MNILSDIKPVVPWDIPGYFDNISLTVPDWVEKDDTLSSVTFTSCAEETLENMIKEKKLAPLYRMDNDGFDNAKEAVKEVLAQDPRAIKRRGAVDQKSQKPYSLIFCSIQIFFHVLHDGKVQIESIESVDLDDADFIDGVPILNV